MSTLDSQLLTLSSIFTRDVVSLVKKTQSETSVTVRAFVILLSLAGLALAYKPPATILQIATQTFTGLAVLFPTVIFGLYFKRVYPLAAILSILCGEGALICFYIKFWMRGDPESIRYGLPAYLTHFFVPPCRPSQYRNNNLWFVTYTNSAAS